MIKKVQLKFSLFLSLPFSPPFQITLQRCCLCCACRIRILRVQTYKSLYGLHFIFWIPARTPREKKTTKKNNQKKKKKKKKKTLLSSPLRIPTPLCFIFPNYFTIFFFFFYFFIHSNVSTDINHDTWGQKRFWVDCLTKQECRLNSLLCCTSVHSINVLDHGLSGGREDSNSKRIYDKEQSHFMTACDYSFAPADWRTRVVRKTSINGEWRQEKSKEVSNLEKNLCSGRPVCSKGYMFCWIVYSKKGKVRSKSKESCLQFL